MTKTVRHEDYKGRTEIENNAEVKAAAIEAWNRRYEPKEIDFDYEAED